MLWPLLLAGKIIAKQQLLWLVRFGSRHNYQQQAQAAH